jgi:hypothetical membrane protein
MEEPGAVLSDSKNLNTLRSWRVALSVMAMQGIGLLFVAGIGIFSDPDNEIRPPIESSWGNYLTLALGLALIVFVLNRLPQIQSEITKLEKDA